MQQYDPLTAETYAKVGITGTWACGFEEVARVLGSIRDKNVLDYGSGTGRSARFLTDLGAIVTGVDINPNMIRKAQRLHPEIGFCPLAQDGRIPADDQAYDFALSAFMHVMVSDGGILQKIESEVYRVLKHGGRYITLTASPEVWGQEYASFLSTLPKEFSRRGGERVYVMLKEEPPIDGYDHFWSEEDHVGWLRSAGFSDIRITKPESKNDLSPMPPFMVIAARKER